MERIYYPKTKMVGIDYKSLIEELESQNYEVSLFSPNIFLIQNGDESYSFQRYGRVMQIGETHNSTHFRKLLDTIQSTIRKEYPNFSY